MHFGRHSPGIAHEDEHRVVDQQHLESPIEAAHQQLRQSLFFADLVEGIFGRRILSLLVIGQSNENQVHELAHFDADGQRQDEPDEVESRLLVLLADCGQESGVEAQSKQAVSPDEGAQRRSGHPE